MDRMGSDWILYIGSDTIHLDRTPTIDRIGQTHPAAEAEAKPTGQDQHGHRRRDQDKPEELVLLLVQLWRNGAFGCSGLEGEDGRVRAVSSGTSVILALVLPERNLSTKTIVSE